MSENARIIDSEILSDSHFLLKKITLEYFKKDGSSEKQVREVYDKGNGATVMLYNQEQKTIILTRQFRLPTYLNGNKSGMLLESCAGQMENESPEDCIRRETIEETGYKLKEVKKVYEAYMSPGAVTEMVHFFIAPYSHDMKISEGGGAEDEKENIEVLEVNFDKAIEMITTGEIRDTKTIMLIQYLRLHHIL